MPVSSVACTSAGSWARSSAAASSHSGIDAGLSQMVSERDAGGVGQHDLRAEHPAPGLAEQVEASADAEVVDQRCAARATNSSTVQNAGSASGRWVLRPQPSWS